MKENTLPDKRIHISLSADVHQKLRVKCALADMSIQEYVEQLIEKETKNIQIAKKREQVHVASEEIKFAKRRDRCQQ